MKKLLCIMLVSVMAVSIVTACGNAQQRQDPPAGTQTGSQAPDKIVELEVLHMGGNFSGLIDGWMGQMLEQNGLAVNLVLLAYDALVPRIASGELGDAIMIDPREQAINAARGNMLLNLDDHKDKLPSLFDKIPNALQFSRDFLSGDTGKLYIVPAAIGPNILNFHVDPYAFYVKWDVFRSLSNPPEVKTLEDTIDLIVAMKEAYPQTADGQETYAFPIWSDWDGGNRFTPAAGILTMLGFGGTEMRHFIQIQAQDNSIQTIFDENGAYKRAMKYLYAVNQEGLIDPDCVTMPYATTVATLTNGAYLTSVYGYPSVYNTQDNLQNGTGYILYDFDEQVITHNNPSSVGHTGRHWCINARTKNVDAALTFLNLLADDEFLFELWNGPEGWFWEFGSDNKPKRTERAWNHFDAAEPWLLPDGMEMTSLNFQTVINSVMFYEKYNARASSSTWPDVIARINDNTLVNDWRQYYNASSPYEYLMKNNKFYYRSEAYYAYMPVMPDDITIIRDAVGNVYIPQSYKMMLAANEGEFQSLWDGMVKDSMALGAQEVIDWAIEQVQAGDALIAKYGAVLK